MSLKSAIRAAADERSKQEGSKQETIKHERKNSGLEENQKARKEENQVTEEGGQIVNLAIKVTKRQRLHWLIAAKKEGTSLTAAITEALNARFGEVPKGS